ncbi:hypothetical protein CBL_09753 [Carabus blaptoides fortunei]
MSFVLLGFAECEQNIEKLIAIIGEIVTSLTTSSTVRLYCWGVLQEEERKTRHKESENNTYCSSFEEIAHLNGGTGYRARRQINRMCRKVRKHHAPEKWSLCANSTSTPGQLDLRTGQPGCSALKAQFLLCRPTSCPVQLPRD